MDKNQKNQQSILSKKVIVNAFNMLQQLHQIKKILKETSERITKTKPDREDKHIVENE